MRELWLLRHGKSDRDAVGSDFDRPLKPRGRRAAQRLGEWLQERGLYPDLIITSPARRALNTAQLVCDALKRPEPPTQEPRLYFSGLEEIKNVLAGCLESAQCVVLVGHNPDLEELLVELVGEDGLPEVEKLMPTAALARLEMPDDWSELEAGCARLIEILYPKSLQE
ncbi:MULTISPECIES: SixA phosphatase family protein [Methylomicrobium]|uniref:Phosphohistidine phosphatase SixA n=1 Tax=Methylomicrobium album BG8 TaxID=686340 RepID=H8GM90_METAL|nr:MULTISPECIES: histidine phosphatase family protein [Methylomicrobium]EIC29451.1 phosphohistidine phosphatase SixA [Methylomicrobium album BG8]